MGDKQETAGIHYSIAIKVLIVMNLSRRYLTAHNKILCVAIDLCGLLRMASKD